MSKEAPSAPAAPQKYDEIVHRLEELVKRLEGGQMTLEDSIRAFEEGMGLVGTGEKILAQAERRIEELVTRDGEARAIPLQTQGAAPKAPAQSRAAGEDEDVPF